MIQYVQPFDLYIHFKRFAIVPYFYLLQGRTCRFDSFDSPVPAGSMELRTTERANSRRKIHEFASSDDNTSLQHAST